MKKILFAVAAVIALAACSKTPAVEADVVPADPNAVDLSVEATPAVAVTPTTVEAPAAQ